ncbi:hypothetical protein GPK75_13410 [[Eubacterium] rectale]|uniref:hypothetical protein n=1 Tax=Agathobacter rectalis TaxID=39491 RepID=UPI0027D2D5F1|nr:hypothetical protein [Agathobacter rectalis]MBT9702020.1 hypothetical protein [Agathobacter rectalis]
MKLFFEKVRTPKKDMSLKIQIMVTIGIIMFGFALGVFQKWMDGSANNLLPLLLQQLDIGNYFGRLAIWILLATVISVYSKSPLRASINTFSFFISMLMGYYLYCNYVLGFLPKTYMMIWVVIAFATFFIAYICWYAKGKGIIAIIISGTIIGVLFAQAFNLTQGFYIYDLMEVITWITSIIILYRNPKELAAELGLSVVIAFLYQLVMPHFG